MPHMYNCVMYMMKKMSEGISKSISAFKLFVDKMDGGMAK